MMALDPRLAPLVRTCLETNPAGLTERLLRAPGGPAVAFGPIAEMRNRQLRWRLEAAAARGLERWSNESAARIYGAAVDRLEAALLAASDRLDTKETSLAA